MKKLLAGLLLVGFALNNQVSAQQTGRAEAGLKRSRYRCSRICLRVTKNSIVSTQKSARPARTFRQSNLCASAARKHSGEATSRGSWRFSVKHKRC